MILIDDAIEDEDTVLMVDDGNGNQVHIPTIMIDYASGEAIKSFIVSKGLNPLISVKFDFP